MATKTVTKSHVVTPEQLISKSSFLDVLNNESTIRDLVEAMLAYWDYDLDSQRPGPAVVHGDTVAASDLDLACLLSTLAKRNAVIILPKYMSGGPSNENKGQHLISKDNRRGQLIRLNSNQQYFSFSALVQDMNVMNEDGSLGAPRNFYIVGKDGRWHPGWESIQFVADAKENKFIGTYGIAVGDNVAFNTFVSPRRWTAFYGPYYLLSKLMIRRLEVEAKVLKSALTAYKSASDGASKSRYSKNSKDKSAFATTKVKVPVMTVEVDADTYGSLNTSGLSKWELEATLKRVNGWLPALRFATRATELAWYKHKGEQGGRPAWVTKEFEDCRIGRTNWRGLQASSYLPVSLEDDIRLRYRIRASTVEMSAKTAS